MEKNLLNREVKRKTNCWSRIFCVLLLAYCLAFAGPRHADAAMIYSGLKNFSIPDEASLALDLDGDGASDFLFANALNYDSFLDHNYYTNYIDLSENPQNAVFGGGNVKNYDPGTSFPGSDDTSWQSWNQDTADTTLSYGYYDLNDLDFNSLSGNFFYRTGFMAVRFQISGNTHYGWVQYQGTSITSSTTKLTDKIVDWAYNDEPFTTGFRMGERECVDNDGDGYGEGPACAGPDLDDNDPTVTDNATCHIVITPGKIIKPLSIIPVKSIVIRSSGSTEFSDKPVINWGTNAIKTIFQLRLNKKTILAVVRVFGLSLDMGSIYQVKVDTCTGQIEVAPLISPIEVTFPEGFMK